MDLKSSSLHIPARQGSTFRRKHQKSQVYTEEQWENLRPDITRLHKRNTARGVRYILEDHHNFFVKYKFLSYVMM
jgi:hypothetical protein